MEGHNSKGQCILVLSKVHMTTLHQFYVVEPEVYFTNTYST